MAEVSPPAVYAVLGTIAEKAGVPRSDLLDGTVWNFSKKIKETVVAQGTSAGSSSCNNEPDTSDINVLFDKLVSDFSELSEAVKTLAAQE